MAVEECAICSEEVPFRETVHLLVHTQRDEGIVDHFVCKSCYDSEIAPAFD